MTGSVTRLNPEVESRPSLPLWIIDEPSPVAYAACWHVEGAKRKPGEFRFRVTAGNGKAPIGF
jgi:hypothetical protein